MLVIAKPLSPFSIPDRDDLIFGVLNRQKSSSFRFTLQDGYAFAHLFALALYSYEKGIPATINAIKDELEEGAGDKPKLVLPPSVKGIEK